MVPTVRLAANLTFTRKLTTLCTVHEMMEAQGDTHITVTTELVYNKLPPELSVPE